MLNKNLLILVLCMMIGMSSFLTSCSAKSADDSEGSTEAVLEDKEPEEYECILTTWGWDEDYWNTVTKKFQETYPNVKFEYTPMANGESLQKYKTAISAGTDLPDIPWAIIDSRAKLFELDMWEPLNEDPYNFDTSVVFEYLEPIMVNSSGQVCGIEQSVNPAGMAYRRDLAKEYFNTDDPTELAELLPDWETFISEGERVKEESGGKIFMLPGMGDIQQIIRDQDSTPWIEDNTVQATKALEGTINLLTQFRDAGIVDKYEAWSPQWYASFGEGKHIFAGCATWSSKYVIQEGDAKGEGEGHWGLMNIPEGNISWGGTTLGISKNCKNKDAAWEFIKFATLSEEGADAIKEIGLFTSYEAYYEKEGASSYEDPWFGGQDTGKFFIDEVVPNIELKPMEQDAIIVHDAIELIVTSLNNDSSMTADTAMENLKEEIKANLPDYEVK
jgi:multiple sugar transport system substrate-binding protein